MSSRDHQQSVSLFHPLVLLYSAGTTLAILGGYRFYINNLRRISTSADIPSHLFRKKFLHGKVTSVGDGDNFHFYHLPGGVMAGWGWLRSLPEINNFKKLKNKTIHVRLCGVDAPERAHFGRPSQPFSDEALFWLRNYILGRRVFFKPLHIDQYNRVVGKVKVLKWTGFKDVSEEMIRNGIGIVYEGKTGAEFDGREANYRLLEKQAKKKKKGLWNVSGKIVTPGEYKAQYRK
ncbi:hypothetical protein B5S28_g3367 [[Candida] boidinii]|uniref:Unnamed protein product n=1 Tax=Candida boidinii TaxID=5477 RepID=A0ACB5TSE3_CANBO|nr:hypothetical protein B5S28_g3367 [[Candida] boidinii]OWB64204.1 hypothetical protein B5S29_g5256 [[Candida] boidinii]OWB74471.1 hypothetical protein B5S31_g4266 [[Candida] boidinii]OWB79596.1 hypothetical protein B5S32_g3825 [[Candida] boidinii]GME70064.1 unnamed protein product [[Candida] boidinii]